MNPTSNMINGCNLNFLLHTDYEIYLFYQVSVNPKYRPNKISYDTFSHLYSFIQIS